MEAEEDIEEYEEDDDDDVDVPIVHRYAPVYNTPKKVQTGDEEVLEYDTRKGIRTPSKSRVADSGALVVPAQCWVDATNASGVELANLQAWLCELPKECTDALVEIFGNLVPIYKLMGRNVSPSAHNVMAPFTRIHPSGTYAVIVGIAPYKDGTATGIPIESIKAGRYIDTPSARAFKHAASVMGYKSLEEADFMTYYYESGMLVLNASFTAVRVKDSRRDVCFDHSIMWAKFMYPFLQYCQQRSIAVLLLGQSAWRLGKAIEGYNLLYKADYPMQTTDYGDFYDYVVYLHENIVACKERLAT